MNGILIAKIAGLPILVAMVLACIFLLIIIGEELYELLTNPRNLNDFVINIGALALCLIGLGIGIFISAMLICLFMM